MIDKLDTIVPLFNDLSGKPLDNGSIYIGEANKNPETNPISIYWDSAKTISAAQPLSTVSGYIVRNGTPSNVYMNSDFSITVKDINGKIIITQLLNTFFSTTDFALKTELEALEDTVKLERVLTTSEVQTRGQDWAGVSYTDADALGANPTALIYPDGTIVGSTDNGKYVKYPNGIWEAWGVNTISTSTVIDLPLNFTTIDVAECNSQDAHENANVTARTLTTITVANYLTSTLSGANGTGDWFVRGK